MAALAEPQAAQRPPRPPPPPFRLPSRFEDTSDLWHTLAEGFWIHVEEDRWVWDFVGVDYISGSIETEPPNPELHVHAYLVNPTTRECYGAFKHDADDDDGQGPWQSFTEITFKDSAGGWWKARYGGDMNEDYLSCVASADPLASLEETPGPLEINNNYWPELQWDNDFAAEFNGAATTGALDQAERPTKRAKINEELGTGEDLQPRAPGSCPRARLAHLRRLIEAKRAGGWFPDLAPFVFEIFTIEKSRGVYFISAFFILNISIQT